MLWTDLNTLFEIMVLKDLQIECKSILDWPKEEPPIEAPQNTASKTVMEKYKAVTYLSEKVHEK